MKQLLNKNGTRKANCFNCEHLEWGFGDVGDPEGFVCNKREYKYDKQEDDHLRLMTHDRYLNFRKSCCELTKKERV